jgi:hypothetical protein
MIPPTNTQPKAERGGGLIYRTAERVPLEEITFIVDIGPKSGQASR